MKKVISISLGSSERNHKVIENINNQEFYIERIGTDGSKEKAIQLIQEMDGKVDAFGMGGTDLYVYAGGRRYTFRESQQIAAAAKLTPIVDGSGLKNTLERRVVSYLQKNRYVEFINKKVLIVCAVDRFGLAEALANAGCSAVYGDLMFALGLPIPVRSLSGLAKLARIMAPIITKMPIKMFYPTGREQDAIKPKFKKYFDEADIIAGDFLFIRRNMPDNLDGKTIITNTVTQKDIDLLKKRGTSVLVTTTPEMQGRSFGTNVIEAVLVALAGKKPQDLTANDYEKILDSIGIVPRIIHFSQ